MFVDHESGISHFYWSVGTNHEYEDIKNFTYSKEECVETGNDYEMKLQDGHAYFIAVKVFPLRIKEAQLVNK